MSISRKKLMLVITAFGLGVVWVFAMRFVLIEKQETHYHANFAVFVNNQRLELDNFTLFEEIATCFDGPEARPQSRAHMHDQVNYVVHVHDDAVTWGHFFANLGMTNGDSVFKTPDETFVEDKNTKIQFILNGMPVETTANRVIGNEDVLLVSIGNASQTELEAQYQQILQDAHVYNERTDPSSCSGGKPLTLIERLKQASAFWR